MESLRTNKIIRLSKSCISNAEKQAVAKVLDHEYLGMGTEVQLFEDALSNFFGRTTICVANGTAALHLAIQSCGIGREDEVLVPSLTYIASFQAISAAGAKPVACDINSESFMLDLKDAEKRLTPRTKAIMPVHYTGGVGDLNSIYEFGKKYNLRVIEDAAHAFGTIYNNRRIGSLGDVVCFSFDGIKNITCGEGGCIVTNDKDVLRKVKDSRLLGVEKDSELRYVEQRSWDFDTKEQGWRYHMSNIMAAIGLAQLKRLPEFTEKRQQLAKYYDKIFKDHPIIKLIPRNYDTVVPHLYVIRIIGMKNRSEIQQIMLEKGIQIGYHYQPNHWLSLYKDVNGNSLPITDKLFPELITLPLHPDISKENIDYLSSELIKILEITID